MLGLTAQVTVYINLQQGAKRNAGESEQATGPGYDFSINHTLFFMSAMVGCPQCAVACFSAPVLIDPFASTAPEQAHQSLGVSLPKLQAPGHYQDITCVGMCNSMWTRTHGCNARMLYVVH